MMKTETFYKNKHLKGAIIYVKRIISRELTGDTALISWWRWDDSINKLVDMNIDDEMFFPRKKNEWEETNL